MSQVITHEQARQITGGRDVFTLVEYEQAVSLLRECLTLDDAKRFATYADAKAAWARIHHDETVLRLSRALKLHAARRMAELAEKERPTKYRRRRGRGGHRPQGARSLLREGGMKAGEIGGAIKLARMSEKDFQALTELPRPPALTNVHKRGEWSAMSPAIHGMLSVVNRVSPAQAATALKNSFALVGVNVQKIRGIYEWCDEFLQRMES